MSRIIAVGHKLFAFAASSSVAVIVSSYLFETTTGLNLTETGTGTNLEES